VAGRYMTSTTLDLVMVGVNFSAADMATLSAKAVTQAEAEVDKYLSKRYDLSSSPFDTSTSIPPIVISLSEQIAEAYMWRWMSRGSKESLKRAKDMLEGAQANLESIRDYEMDLIDTAGDVVADKEDTAFRVECNTSTYTPTFAEDKETNWAVDSDKIQDIADSRDITGADE
jgi:phage gp36-like protein